MVMLWFAATLLAAAQAAPDPQAAPERAPETPTDRPARAETVVCFGDSITFGEGLEDRQRQSYPAQLQRRLDEKFGPGAFRVVNAGISGQDTRQGLKRLGALLELYKPDRVLVQYGTNDLWTTRNIDPKETDANLRKMVRMIKDAGASVVLATLPPVWQSEEKVAERNRIIKAVAADEKVLLADLNAALEEAVKSAGGLDSRKAWERYYLWADDDEGVHPNSLGYTVLAGKWFKAMEAAVEGAADAPASD